MDLFKKTKQFCRQYNIKPARSRGQNFLITENVYDKIIKAADLKKDDIVLEVGSGLGFLTEKMAKKVKKVIAVELDDKLVEILRIRLDSQGVENVEVLNADILKIFNFSARGGPALGWQFLISNQVPNSKSQIPSPKLPIANYKIVANLPYNITSIFLRKFLSMEYKLEMMVLMLQKEVAERIVAKPPKMSLLAVSVQFYAKPEIVEIVPADCFWPKPEVNSAIIKLKVESKKHVLSEVKGFKVDEKDFFRLVKIGFSSKRKMLKNNLAAGFHISREKIEDKLKKIGFNPKIRAQELSVDDWIKLFGVFY